MPDQKDFFISYTAADRDWAEWLAWILEESGYATTIQAWDFTAGTDFILAMDLAAKECRQTLLVLSEDYLRSQFGAKEWATALADDPVGRKRNIIPVRVRPCNLEGLLKTIVYIDCLGLSAVDAKSKLLNALRPRMKPSKAPAFPGGASTPTRRDSAVPFPGLAPSRSHRIMNSDFIREHLLDEYKHLNPSSLVDLDQCAYLFQSFIAEAEWNASPQLLRRVAGHVIRARGTKPMQIAGRPGSGKSSFLSALYLAFDILYRERPDGYPLPLLLDLRQFVCERGYNEEILSSYLGQLEEYIFASRASELVLLLDGVGEPISDKTPGEDLINRFLSKYPACKLVPCVLSDSDYPPIKQLQTSQFAVGSSTLTLTPVPSFNYNELFAKYAAVRPVEVDTQHLKNVLDALGLDVLDLTLLSLILKVAVPVVASPRELGRPQAASALLHDYFQERLGHSRMASAASIAFQISTGAHSSAFFPDSADPIILRSIQWNRAGHEYLVAWHVCRQLMLEAMTQERIDRLDLAFPVAISRFCKDIVTSSAESEALYLDRMESHFSMAGTKLRAHMAYLAGRMRHNRTRVLCLLASWRDELEQRKVVPSIDTLLFARAVYISMAYLGDANAAEDYVNKMIVDVRANHLNRGFHLEYYGDRPWNVSNEAGSIVHTDDGGPWANTMHALLARVRDPHHHGFQIDIFTLLLWHSGG